MAYLTTKAEGEDAFRVDLPENEEAILGRSSERANVVLPSGSVSGRHASITKGAGCFVLRDLGSTNGTRVNGTIVSEEKVFRGDKISFGDYQIFLEGDDVPVGTGKVVKNPNVASAPAVPVSREESAGMKIAPRSSDSLTVKVLPTQFKKRSAHGKLWVAGIVVFSLLAIYLTFLFVNTMVH